LDITSIESMTSLWMLTSSGHNTAVKFTDFCY